MSRKYVFVFICLFSAGYLRAQTDTSETRGVIKVSRHHNETLNITAAVEFDKFDFSKIKGDVFKGQVTVPSPVTDNYNTSFNFTRYFNSQFQEKMIDLENNSSDTVRIAVKILSNGKAYLKDVSKSVMVGGVPAYYDSKVNAYKLNNTHLYCLDFLKELKWIPATVTKTRVGKFKKQQVIIPDRTNVTASGMITIIFSFGTSDE